MNRLDVLRAIDADDLILLIQAQMLHIHTLLTRLLELSDSSFFGHFFDEHLPDRVIQTDCADPLLLGHVVDANHATMRDKHMHLVV